jgi:hypothetical protein
MASAEGVDALGSAEAGQTDAYQVAGKTLIRESELRALIVDVRGPAKKASKDRA